MNFYKLDPESLPADARYFHNILVTTIPVRSDDWEWGEDVIQVCDTSGLTAARPSLVVVYRLDEEIDNLEIDLYPHAVVEVRDCGEVSWYMDADEDEDDFWDFE